MAYNRDDRFPRLPYPYRLFEPGSYQSEKSHKTKLNKAPFLSKTERNTLCGNRIWTHAIYQADPHRKIPNCTSLMSKKPRFPYEALSKEDIEAILCRCGLSNICECTDEDELNEKLKDEVCQGKVHRRLFKGPPPRSGSDGLSVPSRRDHGFEKMTDGTHKRIFKFESDLGPPFYDAEVIESTAFYRGWKWSQLRSTRAMKALERRPGPAEYYLERLPTQDEICAEKTREQKRKHSKQVRYIEMIQQRNLLEGRPGPASYSPKHPKDPEPRYFGPKTRRFQDSIVCVGPGPAAHWIKRDFDVQEPPIIPCLAKLPDPSFFGVKAMRFKPRIEEGPSPATYSPTVKQCCVLNCSAPPFNSTARRFKETPFEEEDDDNDEGHEKNVMTNVICPKPTWEFKSKTIRMKPLEKEPFEQSPADFPMRGFSSQRAKKLQQLSPFCSSEGRFQPWYDWLPVFAKLKTPGPGYYKLEKFRCMPAVCQGPIFRAERFSANRHQSPAPNAYKIGGGLETVLATHNQRLKHNIEHQHKFIWEPPEEPRTLSFAEQETLLLDKAIASLDVNIDTGLDSKQEPNYVKRISDPGESKANDTTNDVKPKLLYYFLYKHPVKPGF